MKHDEAKNDDKRQPDVFSLARLPFPLAMDWRGLRALSIDRVFRPFLSNHDIVARNPRLRRMSAPLALRFETVSPHRACPKPAPFTRLDASSFFGNPATPPDSLATMRVLLIEDDALLGDGLAKGLALTGMAVDWFRSAGEADTASTHAPYDAIVLDLGLPDRDGRTLLAQWRARGMTTPILILTARDTIAERILGLDEGADDYLVKPIVIEELAARLRAAVRRTHGQMAPVWRFGPLQYQPVDRRACWNGKSIELTSQETKLLELFLTHPSRVLTRDFLIEKLYDWQDSPASNTLDVHIHNLRKKLSNDVVRTLRGIGYVLGLKESE